jgi:hypothetical protein
MHQSHKIQRKGFMRASIFTFKKLLDLEMQERFTLKESSLFALTGINVNHMLLLVRKSRHDRDNFLLTELGNTILLCIVTLFIVMKCIHKKSKLIVIMKFNKLHSYLFDLPTFCEHI